jgi:hypothetical protein
VSSDQRLPDRIVKWSHGTKLRLISHGHPVCPSLAFELESTSKHWILGLFGKIHVLDGINGMSEKQPAEAPELFRGIGGEALQAR